MCLMRSYQLWVAFYGGIAALPQLAKFKIGKMRRQKRGLANDAPVR
jgi:hypothetical protein